MFPDVFGFRLKLVDEFAKFSPCAFGRFIGHDHGAFFVYLKSVFFFFFFLKKTFLGFYNITKLRKGKLDKTEMAMTSKNISNRKLSSELEYYQEKQY